MATECAESCAYARAVGHVLLACRRLTRHGVDYPAAPCVGWITGSTPLSNAAQTRLVEHMQLHMSVRLTEHMHLAAGPCLPATHRHMVFNLSSQSVFCSKCAARTREWQADMDVRWKFGRLDQDEMQRVAVRDPGSHVGSWYGQRVSEVSVRVGRDLVNRGFALAARGSWDTKASTLPGRGECAPECEIRKHCSGDASRRSLKTAAAPVRQNFRRRRRHGQNCAVRT